jgi:hypothetical protein
VVSGRSRCTAIVGFDERDRLKTFPNGAAGDSCLKMVPFVQRT